jgi:hypothetical protein
MMSTSFVARPSTLTFSKTVGPIPQPLAAQFSMLTFLTVERRLLLTATGSQQPLHQTQNGMTELPHDVEVDVEPEFLQMTDGC